MDDKTFMSVFGISRIDFEHVVESIDSTFFEKQTPGPNNSCKTKGCKGVVVKEVAGCTSDGYLYKTPACNKCGQEYLYAGEVRVVGVADFEKLLNKQYSI